MATGINNFTPETQLSSTETTLVSAGSSEKKFIGSAGLFNTSTASVEVTFWIMNTSTTGTTGSGSNESIVQSIPPRRDTPVYGLFSKVLESNMKLSGKADTADVINVTVCGTTET